MPDDSASIDDIIIGHRHRRELGDIAGLAKNIADIGLLHPIVIDPDGVLIAGRRRLAAFKVLGWAECPVTVVPIESIARGELAENTCRKDFTLSEMVAITATVEKREHELAKERRIAALKRGDEKPVVENFPNGGRTRDKVAASMGISGRTLEKARAVSQAAEAEPERFGTLADNMDKTGKVDAPYRRLKAMQQAEAIRLEPPPLPGNGPYRVIVADPPWPYDIDLDDPSERGTYTYAQMSLAEIRALNVVSIAAPDAILWLWTTNYHMREAYTVLDAWGFEAKTMLTWAKDRLGQGHWLRGQTEHCLFATRGKPTVMLTNQTTLLAAPRLAHSQKPDLFYALVERLCPAPRYAELFSRSRRPNWDDHGAEIGKLRA